MANSQANIFLSVVIPSYNRFYYCFCAINSVLKQKLPEGLSKESIEVIVVFDGGCKSFHNLLAKSFSDQRICFFYKENGGVASALNYGIKRARGKFINWLSDDDMMSDDHIARFYLKYLSIAKYCLTMPIVIYGGWKFINENNDVIDECLSQKEIIIESLREKCIYPLINSRIHGCSLWIERRLFTRYGYFDESLRVVQDYHKWFVLFARSHLFCECDGKTILSRSHQSQDSKSLPDVCIYEGNLLWKFFAESFASVDVYKGFAAFDYLNFIYSHLKLVNESNPAEMIYALEHLKDLSRSNMPHFIFVLNISETHNIQTNMTSHLSDTNIMESLRNYFNSDIFNLLYVSIFLVNSNNCKSKLIYSNHSLCTPDQNYFDLCQDSGYVNSNNWHVYSLFDQEYSRCIFLNSGAIFEIFSNLTEIVSSNL
jgi:glycosyltransferase involved in cell wall biosynthesis